MRQLVLSVVFSERRKCMCFSERGFRHYFSEPVPAMRAGMERLKRVSDGIVVIIFFKVSR